MNGVDPLYLTEGSNSMNIKRLNSRPVSANLGISLNEATDTPYMHRQQLSMPMSMPDMPINSKHEIQNQYIPYSEQNQPRGAQQQRRRQMRQNGMEYPDPTLKSDYIDSRQDIGDVENLSIAQGPSSEIYSQAPVPDFYYSGARYGNPTEYNNYPAGVSQRISEKDYYESPAFDDIPSSPPSSPARHPPALPQQMRTQGYGHGASTSTYSLSSDFNSILGGFGTNNPLGITPSLAPTTGRIYNGSPLPTEFNGPHSEAMPSIHVDQGYDTNLYDLSSQQNESHYYSEPNNLASTLGSSIPELSPVLSDVHSPSSPLQHDGFTWQPIMTVARSEQSEAIIEQQRKPKQKRKSCLPEGVVDEYVGYTETEGTYICLYPNCLRIFKRTYNLRSHIQTHLCDRPYVCPICESTFVRPHDLRRHERCHTNDRPFVCPCGKRFNRQDAMQRHRMRDICEGSLSKSPNTPKSPKPGRGRNVKSRQQQHLQHQHQHPHIPHQQHYVQPQQHEQQQVKQPYSPPEPSQHHSPAISQPAMQELNSF